MRNSRFSGQKRTFLRHYFGVLEAQFEERAGKLGKNLFEIDTAIFNREAVDLVIRVGKVLEKVICVVSILLFLFASEVCQFFPFHLFSFFEVLKQYFLILRIG